MTDSEAASLGDYLREKREAAGLSIRAAARKADVNDRYLGRLENGEQGNPTIEVLQKLAEALSFDLDESLNTLGVRMTRTLPELRVYFRRKFGASEDDAEMMARLIEKYQGKEEQENGEDIENSDE